MNFSAFLSYVFVASFTPGPNNIMALANSGKYGYRKSVRFCLGVSGGFFIVMLLSGSFNLLLANIVPKIKIYMTFIGAAYMTYLAVKIMQDSGKKGDSDQGENKNNLFLTGTFMQFVNPKGIIYGVTVTGTFITPYYNSKIAVLLFAIMLASVAFLSTTTWSLFGSAFNKFLEKYRKQFNYTMGALLIFSAISGIIHMR